MPDSPTRDHAGPTPIARPRVALANGLRFGLDSLDDLRGAAAGRACIVVEAGSAIAAALPALREAVAGGSAVVATALALRPLLLGGVVPTVVTAVAAQMPEALLDPDLPAESLRRTLLIATADCPLSVLEAFPGPRRVVADTTWRKLGATVFANDDPTLVPLLAEVSSAAVLAMGVSLQLGASLLLLLGVGEETLLAKAPDTSFESRLVPTLNPFSTRELIGAVPELRSACPSGFWRVDEGARRFAHALLGRSGEAEGTPSGAMVPSVAAGAALRAHLSAVAESGQIAESPLRLGGREDSPPARDLLDRWLASSPSNPGSAAEPERAQLIATLDELRTTSESPRAARSIRATATAEPRRVAALLSIEPDRGGLGTPRALDSTFAGKPILQRTLERLATSTSIDEIVLLVPDDFDVEVLLDRQTIRQPVVVERVGASPFGARQEAAIAARLWSDTSWRGGIAEACIFDEIVDPAIAWPVVERRGIDLCVLCGPDWPLVDVSRHTGVDALVEAARRSGRKDLLGALPAPPGISSAVLSAELLQALAERDTTTMLGARLAGSGGVDACAASMPVDERLRRSTVRATFDTPRYKLRLRRAVEPLVVDLDPTPESLAVVGLEPAQCVGAIEHQWLQLPTYTPPHLMLELCTGRFASGLCSPHRFGTIQRPPMSLRLAERILSQVTAARDTVLTLGGVGDPLRHPDVAAIIRFAKRAGVRGVHVRTELICSAELLEAIVAAGVDVVSVDLHATTPETYRRTMGGAEFSVVLRNIELLRACSRRAGALRLPWIVPRMQSRPETRGEVEHFASTWRTLVGAVLVEAPAQHDERSGEPVHDAATRGLMPARVAVREGLRRMTIHSDGAVPASELDQRGEGAIVANLAETPLIDAWRDLFARRRRLRRELGEGAEALRTGGP